MKQTIRTCYVVIVTRRKNGVKFLAVSEHGTPATFQSYSQAKAFKDELVAYHLKAIVKKTTLTFEFLDK